jgi:pimeloyl-ACP methyl ester carboxylesterase
LATASNAPDFGPGFTVNRVPVSGATISAAVGGRGPAIVLLHGYAETSLMWRPLARQLARTNTVIVPDLPAIGESSIPADGIDMKTSADRVRAAVNALGHVEVRVAGHDIGLMIAYAYAAMYRQEVERLALMDAFLPGVAGWEPIFNNPGLWHFRFHGPTPEALVEGRERVYFEHFWNDFAANPKRSIPEADRAAYARAYSAPGRMAAGIAYFKSFPQTAMDFAELAKTRLAIPVLSIGGEKSLGAALGEQVRLIAPDATVIVLNDTGHWIMQERPVETMDALAKFLL